LANITEWFKGFIVAGIILAVVNYIFTNNLAISFFEFIIVVGFASAYAYFTRCKNCNNCFSIWEMNTQPIDSKVSRIPFTKEVEVGRSERHYHYAGGGSRQTHTEIQYEYQNFIKEITRIKYEHTHKCKFCGNITMTYSISESSREYPE
jgi:hypothetical protein